MITQLKRNNPNAVRKQKRFFASDFIKVDSSTINEEPLLSVKDSLKLNKTKDIVIENPERPIRQVRNTNAEEERIVEPIRERMTLRNNPKRNEILNYERPQPKINKLNKLKNDLIGKVFNGEGDQLKILDVSYSNKYKEYVCDVVNIKD